MEIGVFVLKELKLVVHMLMINQKRRREERRGGEGRRGEEGKEKESEGSRERRVTRDASGYSSWS